MKSFRSGFNLVELLVALAASVGVLVVALPVLSASRDQAQSASCQQNLRMIVTSAHQRAADHEGRFFRHWTVPEPIPWPRADNERSAWWDKDQIGNYLPGLQEIYFDAPLKDIHHFKPVVTSFGLGGSWLVCPKAEDEHRSYQMNFWASGIEQRIHPLPAWPEFEGKVWRVPRFAGEFFRQDTILRTNKRIMFSEALALIPAYSGDDKNGWATGGDFGRKNFPGERFAGPSNVRVDGFTNLFKRWDRMRRWPTQFDFGRHGGHRGHSPENGSAYFAYADLSVRLETSDELYDKDRLSTLTAEWSEIDRQLRDLNRR